ncbi:hypothetical protein [Marinicrinis sediminis]|uniref:Lipoprotein n=1 Tax=Marinicrinis sediminis TaxID=1652465 RepID=A0ABW5RCF7_9BACL
MKRWHETGGVTLCIILLAGMLSACGNGNEQASGESFSAAAPSSSVAETSERSEGQAEQAQANQTGSSSSTETRALHSPYDEAKSIEVADKQTDKEIAAETDKQTNKEMDQERYKSTDEETDKSTDENPSGEMKTRGSPHDTLEPSQNSATKQARNEATEQPKEEVSKTSEKPAIAGKSHQTSAPSSSKPARQDGNRLLWDGFFDHGDQTTPSERFWNLSGKQVEIRGYMGEVLSLADNWFLLIPEPGAECPFDNGDETYWNKIMIVFVPADESLRFTSGALSVKGTLDVGIKVDESGYKTMFRLYDASFTSIKE